MQTSPVMLDHIERYQGAFRALADGVRTLDPARLATLDEATAREERDFDQLVADYLAASRALDSDFRQSNDTDTYSAVSAQRRTGALIGGDFLAAQIVAGLAAEGCRAAGVAPEFTWLLEFGTAAQFAETLLATELPRVIAGLRGLEQIGASATPALRATVIAEARSVSEDVFTQGVRVLNSTVRAALPPAQLADWWQHIRPWFREISQDLPVDIRGWLARTIRRMLTAAREKILRVLPPTIVGWAKDILSMLDVIGSVIEIGLKQLYDIDQLYRECEAQVKILDQNKLNATLARLRVIPGHAQSWLQWGAYGATALRLAAPLLHGTGAGIPLAAATGALIVLYTLWVVHDHLDWPQWWKPHLTGTDGVMGVLQG